MKKSKASKTTVYHNKKVAKSYRSVKPCYISVASLTIAERHKKTREFFANCQYILNKKGVNYNPNGMGYTGVENSAKELGVSPELYLWIHASKHVKSINSYVKGEVPSEEITDRLADLANYCALISVYIASKKKGVQNGV